MSTPLLCETVTGRTMAELRAARDAVRDADMVEVRLDGVADADAAGAIEGRRVPVVVTCRAAWEGGSFDGPEETRLRLLTDALRAGAEYVDVEWKADHAAVIGATGGARVIVSNHDFAGVPVDLAARVRAMRATGAEVVKVAAMTRSLSDCLPLLDLPKDGRMVTIGMGPSGVATRLLAARFGSCWSYAGHGAAPGQLPASVMAGTYRFRSLGAATALYGLVGNPVMHSLSPAMHNAAFGAGGLDAVYLPLQATDFEDFERFARRLDVRGASVTIPFKVDALKGARDVDQVARRVGAVNTIRRVAEGWDATNTDVEGFLAPLERLEQKGALTMAGLRVAVVGAGGSARAVVYGLSARGAVVTVHARNTARAAAVAADLGGLGGAWPVPPGSWDLLVNCTPLGSLAQADGSPLPGGPFGGRVVYDLVYAPARTRLLHEAAAAGLTTVGGLDMLVAQAEGQSAWWTGQRPAPGLMAAAARVAQGNEANRHGA